MKTEKVILSFIAVLIGLLVAGVAFYLYQTTKVVDTPMPKKTATISPTPLPEDSLFLTIDKPGNEEVFERKSVTISGKTSPNATVIVSTSLTDEVLTASKNGSFTATTDIEDGQNVLEIIAIAPNGESMKETRVVTFSTEKF